VKQGGGLQVDNSVVLARCCSGRFAYLMMPFFFRKTYSATIATTAIRGSHVLIFLVSMVVGFFAFIVKGGALQSQTHQIFENISLYWQWRF
jgi:hypothetical protein